MSQEIQAQPPSSKSFTSKFFGNYLDNSQIDLTGSEIDSSNTSAIINDQSLTQQQIKAHHLTALLHHFRNISLRQTLYRWIHQKQYRKRLQKRTPNYIAKVLLKVCMLLNVKFKTRCHYFFVRSRKIAKNKNLQIETAASQPNIQSPNCQPIDDNIGKITKDVKKYKTQQNLMIIDGDQKENILSQVGSNNLQARSSNTTQIVSISNIAQTNLQFYQEYKDKVADKYKGITDGVNKLNSFIQKNKNKHNPQAFKAKFFAKLKRNNSKTEKTESLCTLLDEIYIKKHQEGISKIKNWIDWILKLQILKGTIFLMIHPYMRYAFLVLNMQPILNQTEISQIQSNHSQKHSFQINESAQQLVASLQPSQLQNGFFRKKDNEKQYIILKNDPKNLKFTRDIKHKKTPSKCSSSIEQKKAQTQIDECSNMWRKTVYNSEQIAIYGEQNYLIQFRKQNLTPSNSVSNITFHLKKARLPLASQIKLKTLSVMCQLSDNEIQLQMNNTVVNQHFVNISQSYRSRPIRNDDLHPQIPDFNDLFFLRQINSFYQTMGNKDQEYCTHCEIHENQNKKSKSSEQFFQVNNLEKQTNISTFRQSYKRQYQKTSFSRNNCHSLDHHPSAFRSKNKQQLKIPSQLPRNFDYYVDKGYSGKTQQKKSPMSEESSPSRFNHKFRRQTVAKTNSKLTKKLFNVVKSGRTHNSKMHTEYTPRSIDCTQSRKKSKSKGSQEILEFKMVSKVLPNMVQKNKNDNLSQYLINFGDPPKRKLKKRN